MRKENKIIPLFFSLIPLSCMVVLNKELVNILYSFNFNLLFNLPTYNNMNIDMGINTPRDQSNISSTNNSRELSVYSNILFISYAESIQALNNSPFQADQVKINKSQELYLFYVSSEIKKSDNTNEASATANILEQQGEYVNDLNIKTY